MAVQPKLRSAVWLSTGTLLMIWAALLWSEDIQAKLSAISIGGDFTLASADGQVSTEAMRGNVVLVYFGYTFCPDICPTTLSDIAAALKQLDVDELRQTRVIFVSVDPERDTTARLKEYTGYFHPRIVGATGSIAELSRVLGAYRGSFAKHPLEDGQGYSVAHPGSVYVLGLKGELFAVAPHGTSAADLVRVIRAAQHEAPNPLQKRK